MTALDRAGRMWRGLLLSRAAATCVRRRNALAFAPLPRPSTLYFDLQREAEEGSDQDDEGKDRQVLKRWCDGDRSDDVRRDEKLEAQKDASPEVSRYRRNAAGQPSVRRPV